MKRFWFSVIIHPTYNLLRPFLNLPYPPYLHYFFREATLVITTLDPFSFTRNAYLRPYGKVFSLSFYYHTLAFSFGYTFPLAYAASFFSDFSLGFRLSGFFCDQRNPLRGSKWLDY